MQFATYAWVQLFLEHFNKINEECNLYLRKFPKSLLRSILAVPGKE